MIYARSTAFALEDAAANAVSSSAEAPSSIDPPASQPLRPARLRRNSFAAGLRRLVADALAHSPRTRRTVAAAYLYGSNVDRYRRGLRAKGPDLDVLLVGHWNLRGEAEEAARSAFDALRGARLDGWSVGVTTNGDLPADRSESEIIVDLLWDSLPNIRSRDASSIVAANRPRQLLLGEDRYAELAGLRLSRADRVRLADCTSERVRREWFGRADAAADRSIAKAGIFVGSLALRRAPAHGDHAETADQVATSVPALAACMSTFSDVMARRIDRPGRRVRSAYRALERVFPSL